MLNTGLSIDRRRQDARALRTRTAATTTCGSRRRSEADDHPTTAAPTSWNGGETDRAGVPDGADVQRSRRTTCRIRCAAPSRTTPPRACRATATGAQPTTLAAAGAATSRRIRATRMSLRRQLRRPAHASAADQRATGSTSGRQPHGAPSGDMTSASSGRSDRHRADGPEDPVRHVAARLEIDQRGTELAADQPGPVAPRSVDDGGLGRADHAGSDRRRDLRRRVRAGAVAGGRQRDLGGLGRRAGPRHA